MNFSLIMYYKMPTNVFYKVPVFTEVYVRYSLYASGERGIQINLNIRKKGKLTWLAVKPPRILVSIFLKIFISFSFLLTLLEIFYWLYLSFIYDYNFVIIEINWIMESWKIGGGVDSYCTSYPSPSPRGEIFFYII